MKMYYKVESKNVLKELILKIMGVIVLKKLK